MKKTYVIENHLELPILDIFSFIFSEKDIKLKISKNITFIGAKLKMLEVSKSLMENYLFLRATLDNILNSITFANRFYFYHNV